MRNRANIIAQSVNEMLNDIFNVISDVTVAGTELVKVRVVDTHAEYVKKLMEVNYCESLIFVAETNADGVATLAYNCFPFSFA